MNLKLGANTRYTGNIGHKA